MPWQYYRFVSPGRDGEELKDQDRLFIQVDEDVLIAAVCDGTTSSWHSADAAEYVVQSTPGLFVAPEETLARVRDWLLASRLEATRAPIDLSSYPDEMRPYVESAAKARLAESYQTTLAAIHATATDQELRLRWVRCGDSELLIFDRQGAVLFTTAAVRRLGAGTDAAVAAEYRFERTSRVTDVLPDQADRVAVWPIDHVVSETALLVLTSDGLVDAFGSPSELWGWLKAQSFDVENDGTAMAQELHQRLVSRGGDDDIAFLVAWRD